LKAEDGAEEGMKMNNDKKNEIEQITPDTAEQEQESAPVTETENLSPVQQEPEEHEKGKKKNSRFKNYFSSQKFKHGGISTAFTAGFIVVIILINVIVGILGQRYPSMNLDLTKERTNTLSEQSVKVVEKVKSPVTIYILATEAQTKGDQLFSTYGIKYSQVGELAAKMAEKNLNIKVQYMDLDKNPTFANEYKNEKLVTGDVIIKSDKRYRVLAYTDLFDIQFSQDGTSANTYSMVDSGLASGLNAVMSDTLSVASFDTGHSEQMDTTAYKKLLGNNAFETKDMNLLTEAIPEKTQLLVLGCPTTDLTDDEINKLGAFLGNTKLAGDRSLLVTFHPNQPQLPKLSAFLKEWGIEVPQAVVVESDQSKYFNSNPSYILSNLQTTLKLTEKQADYSYFITPQANPIHILFETKGDKTTYSLAKTDDTSYVVDSNTKEDSNPPKAAQNTAVLSQEALKSGEKEYKANVIAMGSTMMFNTEILSVNTFGNGKYIADLSKYATGSTGESTAIPSTPVQTNVSDIKLSTAMANLLGLGVFTLLIPLLIAIAGICVYQKRRHL
jgi:ABC-2 type transport system permease protein